MALGAAGAIAVTLATAPSATAQPAPATQTFTINGSPVTVYGISPDAGTGWNTTYTVLLPGGKLGPGQSVSVAMQFQAVQSGAYSFTYQPEATIAP